MENFCSCDQALVLFLHYDFFLLFCLTFLELRRRACLSFRVVDTGVMIIVGTSRIDLRRSVRPFSLNFDFLRLIF